jgi:hypothetical protein
LIRWPSRVPKGLGLAWAALWLGSALVALLALLTILPSGAWAKLGWAGTDQWQWALAAGAVLVTALVHKMGTSTLGRVVRYTRASPDNIAARAGVRDRGLKLLRALHDGDGPQYKRIVIVAHSLGTILAHDLLSYFWAECEAARTIREGTAEFDALCRLEHAAAQLEKAPLEPLARTAYLAAQRDLRLLLSARPAPRPDQPDPRWRISDLVTFGSPLTHAEFLIAKSEEDLKARKAARELPQSPPYREVLDPIVLKRAESTHEMPIAIPADQTRLMSYPLVGSADAWMLHHAAPFAAVRWTNVYDPAVLVVFGDVIGGPVAPGFGPGVVDIDLKQRRGGRQSWTFTHTQYWATGEESRLKACREAVNLLDRLA